MAHVICADECNTDQIESDYNVLEIVPVVRNNHTHCIICRESLWFYDYEVCEQFLLNTVDMVVQERLNLLADGFVKTR